MKHAKTLHSLFASATLAATIAAPTASFAADAYIESNGSQFINTGYYPSGKTKIAVDFQLTSTAESKDCVFGNYGASAGFSLLLYARPANTYFLFCGKDGDWSSGTAGNPGVEIDMTRHTMVIDVPGRKGTMYAPDGTVQGQTTDFNSAWTCNNTANWPIALFASCNNASGTSARQGVLARIYGAKIWESDDNGATYSLLHNYVPAMKGGYVGFYDTETGDFLSNQPVTSAAFTYGGELLEVEDDSPYVESDGSFWGAVDTRYFPNNTTKVEVDFRQTELWASHDCVFGHYASDYTLILYGPVSGSPLAGTYKLVAKDGQYAGLELSPTVAADTRRHTAVIDVPNRHVEMRAPDGGIQGQADLTSKAWTWNINATSPLALLGSSDGAYGKTKQNVKARIYGAKIWENENPDGSGEWIEKHVFRPCNKGGIVGFKDQVTGKFVSGGNLTAGGNVPEEADDPYIDTGTSGMAISLDTGYYVTANTCVVCDYMPLKQQNSQQFPFEAGDSVSATNANEKSYMRLYGNGSNGQGDIAYTCGKVLFQSTSIPYKPNVRRKVTLDAYNGKVKVETDGEVMREITLDGSCRNPNPSSTTLKILSNGSGNANYCMARLYSFQIYESGSLVRDYRPYVKNGVAGLRDVVGDGGFITASNAANAPKLTCGGNIEGRKDAYIENNHKTVLDLGYKANMSSRIEFDYQWLDVSNSGGEVVCGAWNDGTLRYCLWYYGSKIQFIFSGNNAVKQATPNIAADTMRHTAIMDMYNRSLAYVTDGVTNSVAVNSGATYSASDASVSSMGVFAGLRTSGAPQMVSLARVYSVRIYETIDNVETLVHEFLPYKNGDIVSLRDTVTGHVAEKATTSEPWPTIAGMGVDGAEKWVKELPATASLSEGNNVTLTAAAAGAIRYKWTLNGEVIDGATGETCTATWRKGHHDTPDIYACTAVYDVFGSETEGDPVTCEVANLPNAFVLIVR